MNRGMLKGRYIGVDCALDVDVDVFVGAELGRVERPAESSRSPSCASLLSPFPVPIALRRSSLDSARVLRGSRPLSGWNFGVESLWCRTSLYSFRHSSRILRFSSTFENRCCEGHSRRTMPSKASTRASSPGLPGRERIQLELMPVRPGVEGLQSDFRMG